MITNNQIDKLIGVEESYQSSYKLNEIIKDKEQREELFKEFLLLENDLSYDWFTTWEEYDEAQLKVNEEYHKV